MDANYTYDILNSLKIIQHTMRDHMHDYFKSIGLTGPQGLMMFNIGKKGSMKISDISESMHLSVSTISGIVDRLEKMGYVERVRSEKDRRVVMVQVTDAFKGKMKKKHETMESFMSGVLSACTDEEAECIRSGINKLKELMERNDKGGGEHAETD